MLQFPEKHPLVKRFVKRYDAVFPGALARIRAGDRLASSMWVLLPRLQALTKSRVSQVYSLRGIADAKVFLSRPALADRLQTFCEALLTRDPATLLSPLSARELRASMTLFALAAGENSVFSQVLERFFDGKMDPRTLARLSEKQAFVVEDGVLVDCFGYTGELVIPEGITAIADRVFFRREDLRSVTLPEGLTKIGRSAFFSCGNLVAVHLPQSLTQIDDYAFVSCSALREITLPDGLQILGPHTFHNCSSLTCLRIPTHLQKEATYAVDHLCMLEIKE